MPYLDAVNSQLLAANGDIAGAKRTLSAAQKTIVQRFGEKGFYNLLVNRRARLIADAQKTT